MLACQNITGWLVKNLYPDENLVLHQVNLRVDLVLEQDRPVVTDMIDDQLKRGMVLYTHIIVAELLTLNSNCHQKYAALWNVKSPVMGEIFQYILKLSYTVRGKLGLSRADASRPFLFLGWLVVSTRSVGLISGHCLLIPNPKFQWTIYWDHRPSGMIGMLIFKTGLCMTTVPLTLTTEVQCNWVTRPETSIFCSLFWEKQSQSELTCPRTVRRYTPWRWCRWFWTECPCDKRTRYACRSSFLGEQSSTFINPIQKWGSMPIIACN